VSLRTRLLLAVGAAALVALVLAGVATYSSLRSYLNAQVDQTLENDHVPLEAALRSGQPVGFRTVEQVAPGAFAEVRTTGGQVVGGPMPAIVAGRAWQPALPARISIPSRSPGVGEPHVFFTTSSATPGGPAFRVRASDLGQGDLLVLALPLGEEETTLHRLAIVEGVVAAFALGVALALGWVLVRRGLRPLREVEATAGVIAGGDLQPRVPGSEARTEVGSLARAFNTMLDRIEEAFAQRDATEAALRSSEERLRRFVADASHELRTPLAAVSAYAELFHRGADRRPEDLGRAMAGIRSEAGRMTGLVEDLLLLARLDEGRPLEREPVELVSLSAAAAEAARTVGPAWPVTLEATQPVEVMGDRARLRQVLDNLLANVRAHTPPGTRAWVRVSQEEGQAVVTVSDDGPGLPPGQAGRVFERFYRPDQSRARRHGGAGLGLAIVAGIVSAHGGSVGAGSRPGGGAAFWVRLPLGGEGYRAEQPPAGG